MAEQAVDRDDYRSLVDQRDWRPRNCVWEVTLACNLRCGHCGSRAGRPRDDELSTAECLEIVDQLAELDCELITLSGGEPTLRPDWDLIARAIADRGIFVNMVTNGVYSSDEATREVVRRAADSGMSNVAVSLDGPRGIHELIRGKGTFAKTLSTIGHFTRAGMRVAVMTTVSQLNLRDLPEVRQIAMDAGATMWRLQLAKPMGSMDDQRDLTLAPRHLLELVPMLARLKKSGGIHLAVGDSIGYYGPEDKVLRGWGWRGRKECWQGCQAGMQAIGIEANGGVKGCLSLQARWGDGDPFLEASLRERSLEEIWYTPGIFAFNRDFTIDQLTGSCSGCRFDHLCRGGARCVSSSFLGLLTEDPYCFYRLASEERARRWGSLGRCAAAAAASLLLALGPVGCLESNGQRSGLRDGAISDLYRTDGGIPGDLVADVRQSDPGSYPDITPDLSPEDLPHQPDQGLPDAGQDTGPEIDAGHDPDLSGDAVDAWQPDAEDVEAAIVLAYGVFPDVGLDAPLDAPLDASVEEVPEPINCDQVCCDCEYGVIPDEVWEQCCEPDPCADVSCNDEYGMVPADLWEQCCEPDPCANICCDCDYGDEPIPPGCCDEDRDGRRK